MLAGASGEEPTNIIKVCSYQDCISKNLEGTLSADREGERMKNTLECVIVSRICESISK